MCVRCPKSRRPSGPSSFTGPPPSKQRYGVVSTTDRALFYRSHVSRITVPALLMTQRVTPGNPLPRRLLSSRGIRLPKDSCPGPGPSTLRTLVVPTSSMRDSVDKGTLNLQSQRNGTTPLDGDDRGSGVRGESVDLVAQEET